MINSFPEYEYVNCQNMYRGVDLGKGGYVWAKPGIYRNVWCFDVRGEHPSSIIAMNCFGKYTENYKDLVDARSAIKHGDFESASKMFGGRLAPYLTDPKQAKQLSGALKIAQNSVYGLTAADFPNAFKDKRNVNNIVALRGALFMKTLLDEIINKGFEAVHVKTDSVKVVAPTEELYNFIIDFGEKYGYEFEIEHKFEKFCLINNAVYIAKTMSDDPSDPGKWTATGAQFAQPYVFKTLFSKEPITFEDMCTTKEVSTAIYLDMNEDIPEGEHAYQYVGKVGLFVPIKTGHGGGLLLRENKERTKYDSVTGALGYRWLEAEVAKITKTEEDIDLNYHRKLVDDALAAIAQFGDPEEFIADDLVSNIPPFCTHEDCATCEGLEECQEMSAALAKNERS